MMNLVASELLNMQNYTEKLDLYLSVPEEVKNTYTVNEAKNIYLNYYRLLKKTVLEQNQPVKGVYVAALVEQKELSEIIDSVFGKKGARNILVGRIINCGENLAIEDVEYLKNLDFIACLLGANLKYPKEVTAEYTIDLCLKLQAKAKSLGLSSEMFCMITSSYYGGINAVESLLANRKFWCQIVSEVSRDRNLPKIVMYTAIEPQFSLSEWDTLPNRSKSEFSWWRRTHPSSYKIEAFVERFGEVFNSNSSLNCKRLCSRCEKSSDCCIGSCVSDIFNFTRVCRYNSTVCEHHSPILRSQYRKKSDLSLYNKSDSPTKTELPIISTHTTAQYVLICSLVVFIVLLVLLFCYYVSTNDHILANLPTNLYDFCFRNDDKCIF